MKKLLNTIFSGPFLDNRFIQILVLPISLYNTYHTYRYMLKEDAIFRQTINENDAFFKAIGTMGFIPDEKHSYILKSKMPVDKIFSLQDVQNIANETIIKAIMEYVKDESLLGIVLVKCDFSATNSEVDISIQPAHYDMYINDKKDLMQSLKLTGLFLLIASTIFSFVKWLY